MVGADGELRERLCCESCLDDALRLWPRLPPAMSMPDGGGEKAGGGEEADTFGEDERRGREGVLVRDKERRGWSCARPNEKASLAGRAITE